MSGERIPVLVDCDPGIDDAAALLYLLGHERVDVVGITTVFGNNTAPVCAVNALRILELVGRADIPVAIGAEAPLDGTLDFVSTSVHGEDGLGDAGLPPLRGARPVEEDAVALIDRLSREHEGRLQLLAVAPLTNLAHALDRLPGVEERVARVVIMGGAADAPGNVTPAGEANIIHDPEAAQRVVAAGWETVLVPLDVTMRDLMTEAHLDRLRAEGGEVARFIADASEFYFDFYLEDSYDVRCAAQHDALAAGVLTGDVVPVSAPRLPVEVDCSDGPGRGKTWVDTRQRYRGFRGAPEGNCTVVLETDGRFAELLVDRLVRFRI
ncbi:nucleoside hydrolase [Homoserinibacter sp. YIM 151385]|uniref:nucleoside hydrolase n=1 Tax=Homoserinibacter sp. YIM 151385 TaxID=2985506 RepID=UPI0022F049B8|nr:nucleoside hydrolase [Homoserinibacter sp. YIM 151385]WBU38276.1 nucleoside hydrolase [Homoserinibacter sp. YIM 151385]